MAKLGNNNFSSVKTTDSGNFIVARVIDIILDVNHPRAEEFGGYDGIGTIFWCYINEPNQTEEGNDLNFARPLFSFIKQYPLKNEIVLLTSAINKNYTFAELDHSRLATQKYYLPNVNIWNHQHNNALPDITYYLEDEKDPVNFESVGGVLIRTGEGDNSVEIPLGKYFKENLKIQPLLPFEGDTIIEGRFGNSIRLGATAKEANDKTAYSTKGENGDPITIIRNGQHVEEKDNGWEHTIENINSDHSTIYLTSNQVLPNMEIVSTHWQSWMAKHDTLEVEQKDDFDNITEGFEVESIEPEKPEEGADQELEEATEEDIAAEEDKNEDPEDCKFWGDEVDYEQTEGEGKKRGYPVDDIETTPHPKSPENPNYAQIEEDEETTGTTEDNDIQTPSTIPPIPPDIPYEIEAWVQYYDPTTTGMEILFWIMRGYKRTDGEEKKNFFLKDEGPYPAGSLREYVFDFDPMGYGDWGNVDLKEELERLINEYRAGDRL